MPTTASNKIYFRVDDDNEICIEPSRWYTYLDEHDLLEMLGALHPKKESQDSGISALKTDNEALVKRITTLELQMIKMQELADYVTLLQKTQIGGNFKGACYEDTVQVPRGLLNRLAVSNGGYGVEELFAYSRVDAIKELSTLLWRESL